MSKATVLQKSIEHIQQVQSEKKMKEEELNGLRKEVIALQIMKSNYSDLVKVHQVSRQKNFLREILGPPSIMQS